MRVVRNQDELLERPDAAPGARPAAAFGNAEVFLEKFIERAKHIEVQILGDRTATSSTSSSATARSSAATRRSSSSRPRSDLDRAQRAGASAPTRRQDRPRGQLRQRRHRRVPADAETGDVLLHRGQPAHPGRAHRHRGGDRHRHRARRRSDRRRARRSRDRRDRHRRSQADIRCDGYAIQCRITTEDPENNFIPDYGRITAYRSPGGFGIRLDGGTGLFRARSSRRYYDSLLVKVTTWGADASDAAASMDRAPARVPHPRRQDQHPLPRERHRPPDLPRRPVRPPPSSTRRRSCSAVAAQQDRATKLLTFIGDVIVNG